MLSVSKQPASTSPRSEEDSRETHGIILLAVEKLFNWEEKTRWMNQKEVAGSLYRLAGLNTWEEALNRSIDNWIDSLWKVSLFIENCRFESNLSNSWGVHLYGDKENAFIDLNYKDVNDTRSLSLHWWSVGCTYVRSETDWKTAFVTIKIDTFAHIKEVHTHSHVLPLQRSSKQLLNQRERELFDLCERSKEADLGVDYNEKIKKTLEVSE